MLVEPVISIIDNTSYIKILLKATAIQSSPLIMASIQMMTDIAVNSNRFTTYSPNFSSVIKAFRNAYAKNFRPSVLYPQY